MIQQGAFLCIHLYIYIFRIVTINVVTLSYKKKELQKNIKITYSYQLEYVALETIFRASYLIPWIWKSKLAKKESPRLLWSFSFLCSAPHKKKIKKIKIKKTRIDYVYNLKNIETWKKKVRNWIKAFLCCLTINCLYNLIFTCFW